MRENISYTLFKNSEFALKSVEIIFGLSVVYGKSLTHSGVVITITFV